MSALNNLFVGEFLNERYDGFPNQCAFCGGEEHTVVQHYEDCIKQLAEVEYIQLKADLDNAYKEIRDMNTPMSCGHSARYQTKDNNTQYCVVCVLEATQLTILNLTMEDE